MFYVFSSTFQHHEKFVEKSNDLRNHFFEIFDLTSCFVTQGQKEGGISFGHWNLDRWLSQQRTHKFEYVFCCWWTNQELKQKQSKLNFWNQLHPKIAFLCCFWTQTATWGQNHTILTSSVNAFLKAMIDTVFLGPSLRGGQNFLITVGGFYNEREYSGADWPVLLLRQFCWMVGFFLFDKVVKLVGGGSVINGAYPV